MKVVFSSVRDMKDSDVDFRHHEEPRYRAYRMSDYRKWNAVCVQWFDYFDYNGEFFPGWFDNEESAMSFCALLNRIESRQWRDE